jgi:trk system potassium uptake protein TrkH
VAPVTYVPTAGAERPIAIARLESRSTWKLPSTTLHVTGVGLLFLAAGMAACTLLEALTTNRDTGALGASTVMVGVIGFTLWRTTVVGSVRARNVFAAVGWTWVIVTLLGALPFVLAGTFALPGVDFVEQLVDAVFESASGFSCTGSTVLGDFARPGRGMLMYRQATQWYGGMGMVVLAVTILPFLGVGGLDLIAAEAPGPSSDRLAPRVSESAKRLWLIYVLYTLAVALLLFVVPGPSLYDSVAHALTTASTGGFSPHGDSIGYFDSVTVEIVIMAGMFYGGANFALHWRAATGELGAYRRDAEFRWYVIMVVAATGIVVTFLCLDNGFGFATGLRVGVFNVMSLATSTGYGNATGAGSAGDYVLWAPAAQLVLLFLLASGACTGSTSGGIKVMRNQVLFGHALRSIRRTQQPRAVIPVRHGAHAVDEDIVARVAGFFLVYAVVAGVGVMALTLLDADFETSIGAIAGALGGMGPALNEAGPTASFADPFTQPARLVLALFMVIGRLEIFPMLLMFAAPYRAVHDRLR